MILVPALQIQCESALGDLAQSDFAAYLHFVKLRRQLTLWDKLDEYFQLFFVGRRHDRVSPLDRLFVSPHSERGILPGDELEFPAWINPDFPEIGGEFLAVSNMRAMKLFI